MQAPAGRSTLNPTSSKTLPTTGMLNTSPGNTAVPTIAFIGMPTTTTIKPKFTQISEPLTKANAAATKMQSPTEDEALKTPTILKSILKTNESLSGHSAKNQKIMAKTKLHLNVSKSSKINEIQKEVVIRPKKPAPKSPQNPSYIPVYIPKLLTSGSPMKNNDDMAVQSSENQADVEESTIDVEAKETETNSTVEENKQDTSILENLLIYKEVQEMSKTSANISSPSDTVDSSVVEIRPSSEGENEIESDGSKTACGEYADNQLDEFLADEAESIMSSSNNSCSLEKKCDKNEYEQHSQIYVNEQFKQSASIENFPDESHYLPMTPKRRDFAQGGDIFTLSLNDSTADEENPYVEMTKFLHDEEAKTNYEVMCIGKSSLAQLNRTSEKVKHCEPVYMELPGAKYNTPSTSKEAKENEEINSSAGKSILKKCKKGGDTIKKKVKKTSERVQNKRKDLPDILKPPQSSINLSSDSSDADDESSKHIDLKKMRSRTRFSLSDTFRPASYYLGASTSLNNFAESSDSEIVPPPPIPVSPSPIDEMKTEEIFSCENYDTVKRRDSSNGSKIDLKIHSSNISLDLPKAESTLKSSRLSLPDHLSKNRHSKAPPALLGQHHERTLSDSNYSFQTDNSSNTSSDFDLYNKLSLTTPSPLRYQSNSSLPQKYSCSSGPIKAPGDSSEAESVELRHIQTSDSELEKNRSRRPLSQESIEAIELLNEKFEEGMPTHDLDTYLDNLQSSDLQLYQNENRAVSSCVTNLIKPPEIFRNKDDEKFYGDIKFASSLDSLQKGEHSQQHENSNSNDLTPTSTDHEQTTFYTPMHSRNNSNISEQSAPYYYSQLSSSREMVSSPTTLNNQRDIHGHGCNISQIHNAIEKAGISVEMLADKYQTVDSRNLYKSNVEKLTYSPGKNLKNNKIASPPLKMSNYNTNKPNHAIITDSPSHLHLTTNSQTANPNEAKSSNIIMAQGEHLSGGGSTEEMCNADKPKVPSFLGAKNSGGERLWEEDTLWRESLRKVSQRHAKSMDELDRIVPTYTAKREPVKAKISRDVTYVNDHVSHHKRANSAKPSKEAELKEKTEEDQMSANDVYVQLMDNANETSKADDLYEMLREDTSSTISHKSAEIDRETIRQWDAMSSGINTNSDINAASTPLSVQAIVQQLNSKKTNNASRKSSPK